MNVLNSLIGLPFSFLDGDPMMLYVIKDLGLNEYGIFSDDDHYIATVVDVKEDMIVWSKEILGTHVTGNLLISKIN